MCHIFSHDSAPHTCCVACSWLYLSRLAAIKEYAFMVALGEHGLPVPYAVAQNRHAVLMSLVDAVPLVQVGGKTRRAYVAGGRSSIGADGVIVISAGDTDHSEGTLIVFAEW